MVMGVHCMGVEGEGVEVDGSALFFKFFLVPPSLRRGQRRTFGRGRRRLHTNFFFETLIY